MSPEAKKEISVKLTPQEVAFKKLDDLVPESGTLEVNPNFSLRRRVEINGRRRKKESVTIIVARLSSRENGRNEEAQFEFDRLGLLSLEIMTEPILTDVLGIPRRNSTRSVKRSDYETTDEQRYFSKAIVIFVANVEKMLEVQFENASSQSGANGQKELDPNRPPAA